MPAASGAPPAGFVRFFVRGFEVVCAPHVEAATRAALSAHTLYQFAEAHPAARRLEGRGAAYAIPLPGDVDRVVVRHNRHGGALAPLTRDLFAPPTRAPYELDVAERLRKGGVVTPLMLGYVVYPAGPFRRADVMTREVPRSSDLSVPLLSGDATVRAAALTAAASLVRALSDAGARHHDLNIKNILLHEDASGRQEALVLDVDRVTFGGAPRDVLEQNLARLLRSARKWQSRFGAQVTDGELDAFATLVHSSAS